jgi:hypothetical protein
VGITPDGLNLALLADDHEFLICLLHGEILFLNQAGRFALQKSKIIVSCHVFFLNKIYLIACFDPLKDLCRNFLLLIYVRISMRLRIELVVLI